VIEILNWRPTLRIAYLTHKYDLGVKDLSLAIASRDIEGKAGLKIQY
jgi:hypothetical protein